MSNKKNRKFLIFLALSVFMFSCVTSSQLAPPSKQNEITVVVDFLSIDGYFYDKHISSKEVQEVVAEEVCDNKTFYDFSIVSSKNW